MGIHIIPGTPETFAEMKGQKFSPHKGEGLVYIKLAFLKPETLESGDPQAVVEGTQGVILCGQLDQIKDQINKWFIEASQEYSGNERF